MKKIIFGTAIMLATVSAFADDFYTGDLDVRCFAEGESEELLVDLLDNSIRVENKVYQVEMVDRSRKTWMRYNGDVLPTRWQVIDVTAKNESNTIILSYYAASGSKNRTDGKVIITKNGIQKTYQECTSGGRID